MSAASYSYLQVCRDRITDAENDLEGYKAAYLRAAGWGYSSSNPSCCWMWERVFPDGRVVMVGTEAAITMQDMLTQVQS